MKLDTGKAWVFPKMKSEPLSYFLMCKFGKSGFLGIFENFGDQNF